MLVYRDPAQPSPTLAGGYGVVLLGKFVPSAEAASLSKALLIVRPSAGGSPQWPRRALAPTSCIP
jgi:hypothetical protein